MAITPYLVLLPLSTVILVLLGLWSLRLHRTPVVVLFAILMVLSAGWALTYFLEIVSPGAAEKIFWAKAIFIFTAPNTTIQLLLVLSFVGYTRLLERRSLLVLFIVPVLTIFMAMASPSIPFLRSEYTIVSTGPFPVVEFRNGPWFWVHIIYSYGLVLVALTALFTANRRFHPFYLQQAFLMVACALPAAISDILYEFKITPIQGYNLTPSVFVIMGVGLFLVLFRFRVFDIVPFARSRVFDTIQDLVIITDRSGRLVDYNPAAHQVLGSAALQISAPLAAVFARWAMFLQLFQESKVKRGQFETQPGTQGATVYEFSSTPIMDNLGQTAGHMIIFRDMTARLQAEEAMRQSEQRYRMLAENVTDVIWTMDIHTGRTTYVSPAIERLRGYTPDEVLKQSLEETYTPESTKIVRGVLNEWAELIKRGEIPEMARDELEQICKDGSTVWTEVTISPVYNPDGSFMCLLGDARDITERREMERSLRASEALHRSIVSASPDGIIITSLDGQISYVSPAALRLFGIDRFEDLQGKPFSEFLYEDDRQKIAHNNQLISMGLHRGVEEYRIYHKGSGLFFIEVNTEVLHGADSQAVGLVYVIRDITRRKLLEQAETRARRIAEALQQAGLAINSTLDFKEMLDRILDQVVQVIQCDMGSVLIRDEDMIQLTATHGYPAPAEIIGARFSLVAGDANESPNHLVFEQKLPVIVGDVIGSYPPFKNKKTRSWMGIPLFSRNDIIGFLNLDSYEANHFTAEDQRMAEMFGHQVSIALENARLYQEAQSRIQGLSILQEVVQSVIAHLDLDELLDQVYHQVNRFLNSRFFLIAGYDADVEEWYSMILIENGQRVDPVRFMVTEGFAGYVIQNRRPIYLSNARKVQQFIEETGRLGVLSLPSSIMIVPLVVSGDLVGVMGAQCDDNDTAFTPDDFTLFTSIGAQVSVAIENARLYARMEQLAITDGLTEIYNRRYFFTLAEKEIARALRYHTPLSVIMVDIDHFKRVNDTYGHAVGDVVLKDVAQIIKHQLRQVDVVGRYGGEEFIMALPETRKKDALILANRVLTIIATQEFKTHNASIFISASMGVSEVEGSQDTLEAVLERADQALYAAKQAGRNQVK